MCGLYGFVGKPKDSTLVAHLIAALAHFTKIRGEHSTGYYALTKEEGILEKGAIEPDTFIKNSGMIKTIAEEGAYLYIGHNRWASAGAINNTNSHPFEGKRYVLAHNGTCREALRTVRTEGHKMKGDTDSEAILTLLEVYGFESFSDLLEELSDFSLTVLDKKTEIMYFARNTVKPLYIVDLREQLGVRVWSSTPEIMLRALEYVKIDPATVKGFSTKPGSIYRLDSKDPKLEVERLGQFAIVDQSVFWASYPSIKKDLDAEQRAKYKN